MLYLNDGKKDGQWTPNLYGGNENLAAIEFLKHLNSILTQKYQDVLKFAEDTTAYPRITDSPEENGLGFDRTWNHGWSKDYLTYIQYDPYFGSHHHKELICSIV